MSKNFQKLVKRDIECDLEKEIDENDEETTDGIDDVDISLDVIKTTSTIKVYSIYLVWKI